MLGAVDTSALKIRFTLFRGAFHFLELMCLPLWGLDLVRSKSWEKCKWALSICSPIKGWSHQHPLKKWGLRVESISQLFAIYVSLPCRYHLSRMGSCKESSFVQELTSGPVKYGPGPWWARAQRLIISYWWASGSPNGRLTSVYPNSLCPINYKVFHEFQLHEFSLLVG